MSDGVNPSGGIVMADLPVQPPPVPVPISQVALESGESSVSTVPQEPPPFPTQPAVESSNPTVSTVNPFIPGGSPAPTAPLPKTGNPPPPKTGKPFIRRILMIFVFLIILAGLIFAGRFVFTMFAGTKEVTLSYWGLWENDAMIQSVITDFQAKNPKIKIEYVKQSPKQYRERLSAAIARGDGPDIFRFHNTWLPMLRNDISAAPKTVITSAEFSTTFYPVAQNDLVAGSNIYGIPLMIDGLGLYYNEDIFTAAGVVGPPTTWEELLSIVPRIAKPDGSGFSVSAIALGTANNVENFSDILATMMMQNGADLTSPSGREAEEALVFYRKFATPSDPVYTWNQTMDNSIYAFASGKVAMILAPSWRVFDIKQINPSLRFKIVPMPQLPGSTTTWASYWVEGVSSKSKSVDAAWQFVKFLTSRESAVKLYTEASKTRLFGEPYARVDLADSLRDDPYVGAFIKQASTARSFPLASRTFDNGINDKLIKYLEDAVNAVEGGNAPSAALQTATAGFGQVLGTYGIVVSGAAQTAP